MTFGDSRRPFVPKTKVGWNVSKCPFRLEMRNCDQLRPKPAGPVANEKVVSSNLIARSTIFRWTSALRRQAVSRVLLLSVCASLVPTCSAQGDSLGRETRRQFIGFPLPGYA